MNQEKNINLGLKITLLANTQWLFPDFSRVFFRFSVNFEAKFWVQKKVATL